MSTRPKLGSVKRGESVSGSDAKEAVAIIRFGEFRQVSRAADSSSQRKVVRLSISSERPFGSLLSYFEKEIITNSRNESLRTGRINLFLFWFGAIAARFPAAIPMSCLAFRSRIARWH
jgi:hypothetical protein